MTPPPKKYRVVQSPAWNNKWVCQLWYPLNRVWGDVGDAVDTRQEAEAKMKREIALDKEEDDG